MQSPRPLWKNLPASTLQPGSQLMQDWDRLSARNGDLPFLAGDVILSALNLLGTGRERLLIAHKGSDVVAMLVLCPVGKFRWQTFQPSQIPLGAWVADTPVSLLELGRSLLRGPLGPLGLCFGLSFTQVDPHIAPRTADSPDSQTKDYIETGWIDISGSFDDYWSARGKNLRQNMRKQHTKLLADGIKLTTQRLTDFADMAPAVARYGSLESAGWKAENGTAVHPDNEQGRFYREMLEHASLRGEAVVYQYLFGDRVVAINLCLARKGTLIVLKTTYDESIQSYSPAFLLRENELQQFHDEGQIHRLEYFGRFMEWHSKLTDKKRTLYHLTVYRWPFLKKLAEARSRKVTAKENAKAGEEPVNAEAKPG